MYQKIISVLIVLVVMQSVAYAAALGIPAPRSILSGIGVISGWKCQVNGELTVRFNGGAPVPLLYGAQRPDVLRAGACSHDRVGFLTIMNWGELGDGYHTAVAYDDGKEFARSRFQVVTTGTAFLADRSGQCVAEDFPFPGDESRFLWNEATQHMELVQVRDWYDVQDTGLPASADLDFLLERAEWTIEVPDILSWKYVSEWENPEYQGGFDANPNWRGGNRYVAGPAPVEFLRYVHGSTSHRLYPFSEMPP